MEISLRPSYEVPQTFVERLKERRLGDRALAITMSADFSNNPVMDGLVEYGQPDDIAAIDYFGHRHGVAPRLPKHTGHEGPRDRFIVSFQGSYIVLGEPANKSRVERYYQGLVVSRSHIKALAVGPKILSAGGVNLTKHNYENCVDAMFDFESQEFADFLMYFAENEGNLRDNDGPGGVLILDEESDILVDWGKSSESLIVESLLADLHEEDISSVTMSSSYMPAGHIYGALSKIAKTGSEVIVYTNSLKKYKKPNQSTGERKTMREDLAAIALGRLLNRRGSPQIVDCLPKGKFNHFKAIVVSKKDGSKIAYTGSHNFHPISVMMGTAEVALRTTDQELIDQIEKFIERNLSASLDRPKNRLYGLRDIATTIASPL